MREDHDFGYGCLDSDYSAHGQILFSQEGGIAGSIHKDNACKFSALLAYDPWDQTAIGSNAVYPEPWGDISRRKESMVLPPSQITLLHL